MLQCKIWFLSIADAVDFCISGVRQANRMRHAYLASVLKQEVAFFDTDTSSGKLLHGLNEDSVTVQNAISEKAGNFIHHIFTFLVGIAIGRSPVPNSMLPHQL